jgi:site-specific DNA-methyltransferase (adenine-specific)
MTALYHNSKYCTLYLGNSLDILKTITSQTVDVIFFSPPYYQQRNYGIPGQIGLEPTFEEYLTKLLSVTNECKRVIKDTGSLWLVIEDTYNAAKRGGITSGQSEHGSTIRQKAGFLETQNKFEFFKPLQRGIPEHSRLLIPERLATVMVDRQQWCLRNDICWHKPNAMPESAKSRLTTSWEHVYFFTKRGQDYIFDTRYEAFVTEKEQQENTHSVFGGSKGQAYRPPTYSRKPWDLKTEKGRIMRDMWAIPNKGYKGMHFATYPIDLVKPAIEACCPVNGGIVLDPFAGVCTTGIAALELGRRFIGIDINESFLKEGLSRLDKHINQERLFF